MTLWELLSSPFDRYAHARSIPDNNETGHAIDEQTNIERIQVQTRTLSGKNARNDITDCDLTPSGVEQRRALDNSIGGLHFSDQTAAIFFLCSPLGPQVRLQCLIFLTLLQSLL